MNPTIDNLNDPEWWSQYAPEGATHVSEDGKFAKFHHGDCFISSPGTNYAVGHCHWINIGGVPSDYEFYRRPNHSVDATDMVNQPPHYQSDDGIECIDAIRAQLTEEEFRGYCKGNIAKYVWRERHKGGTESLRKAEWYLGQITKR